MTRLATTGSSTINAPILSTSSKFGGSLPVPCAGNSPLLIIGAISTDAPTPRIDATMMSTTIRNERPR